MGKLHCVRNNCVLRGQVQHLHCRDEKVWAKRNGPEIVRGTLIKDVAVALLMWLKVDNH